MKTFLLNTNSLFFTLFLIVLSTLSSCDKNEGIDPETTSTTPECLVKKLIAQYSNSDEPFDSRIYHYDSQNRLVKWTSTLQEKEKAEATYEYNSQGQLIKLTLKDKYLSNGQFTIDVTDIFTFEYNDKEQVAKYVNERPVPQSGTYSRATSETTLEYDSQGNRTKSTLTSPDFPDPFVGEFTYQDGNIIKAVYGRDLASERVEDYEYYLDREDKYRQIYLQTYLTSHTPNKNMIKKTVVNSTHSDIDRTTEVSYEFNDKGFSTKAIIETTTPSGNYTTFNVVEYNCR